MVAKWDAPTPGFSPARIHAQGTAHPLGKAANAIEINCVQDAGEG